MSILELFHKNEDWLKEDERARIDKYMQYENVYTGEHHEAFNVHIPAHEIKVYIAVNFGKLMSNLSADMLFGEPPSIVSKQGNEAEQQAIDRLIEKNNLHTINYESSVSNSYHGDGYYKVSYRKKNIDSKEKEVLIEVLHPAVVFPILDEDDKREVLAYELRWTKKLGKKEYLRKEIHRRGKIINELWELDGYKLKNKVPLEVLYEEPPEEEVETGIDDFLIVHIPNTRRSTEFFGDSDYQGLMGIFEELNNRISAISTVLDKHSDPKLVVPKGSLSEDGTVSISDDLWEVGPNEDVKYVVWNAQLEAAFNQVDNLIQNAMMIAEISPSLLGMDNGGQAESGRALKFKLFRTLSKIERKKTYYKQALEKVLNIAMQLENQFTANSYPISGVDVEFKQDLVNEKSDTIEDTIKLKENGLIPLKEALRKTHPQSSEESIENMYQELMGYETEQG